WLEQNAGDLSELDEIAGWHLEKATRYGRELGASMAPDLARDAATHLRTAGDRAFDRGDLPAAANLLGRAVDLLPDDDPTRPGLLVDVGSVQTEAGDLAQAVSTFDLAFTEAQKVGAEDAQWRARVGQAWIN